MDEQTPQQISAPLHKHGTETPSLQGSLPENPFLVTRKHQQVSHAHGKESTTLHDVHITDESVATFEMTPPHPPRVETELYKKSRHYLIEVQNKPCVVCGVSKKTIEDADINIFGATTLETHHYPIERSLMNACDPNKVHHAFPEVIDRETLENFVDSTRNLLVLCDVHHRSLEQGIHHLLVQDYAILPYLYTNYQIVATERDKDIVRVKDEKIEKEQNGEISSQ